MFRYLLALSTPLYNTPADPIGGGGGGNPNPSGTAAPEAKFTQADLDRIAASVRRETEQKFADYQQIKEKAGQVDTLSKEMQDLKDQIELKDKDAAEKEKILAQRAREQSEREMAALRTERDGFKTAAEGSAKALRDFQLSLNVSEALTKSGVLAGATKHAVSVFLAEAEIELGDKGEVKGVKVAGVPQKDMLTAAATWLSTNTHFKAAAPGGSGTTTPNGGPVTPDALTNMSASSALAAGMSAPIGGAPANQWDANQ